jgi:hypothetical protein
MKMIRLILAALTAVCLTTAVQAQQSLEGAENSDACRIARGERPLGYRSTISPSYAQAQSVCEIIKKAAIERQERARRTIIESARRKEELERQNVQLEAQRAAEAAERKAEQEKQAAAAEAKAIEDAKPINVLFRAHTRYIFVNVCHQNRKGYLMVFINDVELDRAEKAIHAILAQQKKRDSQIDTDLAYNEAMKEISRLPITDSLCHWKYNELMNMSPVAEYVVPKPQ